MLVQPFPRINFYSVHQDAEVQVVAAGHAGCAGIADDVTFDYLVADGDADAAQVGIEALQSESVVDDDTLTVDAEIFGVYDRAVVGGRDR